MTTSFTNAVKRTLAGVSALVMLASAASCSAPTPSTQSGDKASQSSNSGESNPGGDVAQVKQSGNSYTYVGEDLEGLPELQNLDQIFICPGSEKIYITAYGGESGMVIYQTTKEFKEFKPLTIESEDNEHTESYWQPYFGYDGTVYIIRNVTDFGDKEAPNYDDPDFDYTTFDYEAYYKDAVTTSTICQLDDEGKVVKEFTVSGLDEYSSGDGYSANIGQLFPCKDGKFIANIYSDQEYYILIDEEGNIEKQLDFGDLWFNSPLFDQEGNINVLTYGETGQEIRTIDAAEAKLLDSAIKLDDDLMSTGSISNGYGDYKFLVSTSTDLFGLKEDGTSEKIINWTDSDINGSAVRSVIPMDDGSFIAVLNGYMTGESSIMRLTKGDENAPEKQIVTIGVSYADSTITSKITDFNKSNSDYRFKVVDYSKYYEYDEDSQKMTNTAESQMKMDIVSGNAPDILVLDPSYIQSLAAKGTFVNLDEYIDKDSDLSRDDLVSNVIKLGEVDGKLYSLSPGFYINTLACKSKFYEKDSWTVDDFIETVKKLPEGMKMFQWQNTKEEAFSYLSLNGLDFIDFKTGTCSFDSPEFINVLEFCNTLPEEEEERDWSTMSDAEMKEESELQMNGVRNEKVFLYDMYLSDFQSYVQAKGSQFEGSEMNLIGYPTANGSVARVFGMNSFCILNSSEHKDICWEFIKQFFTEDYQTSQFFYGVPGLKKVLDKKLDETMEDPYWVDENGKKNTYKNTYQIDGKTVEIPNLTKEERDELAAYIESIGAGIGYSYNEEIDGIINEEVTAYFKGERSAQEAADLIQNRVSILVSEQS